MFPDAKTERGQKHLRELTQIAQQGQQAVIFFAILHSGINTFEVARQIDPKYAQLFEQAILSGVKPIIYKVEIEQENTYPIGLKLTKVINL